jgi:hypothetical protein
MRHRSLHAASVLLLLLLIIIASFAEGWAQKETGARRRPVTQSRSTVLFELIEHGHNPSIVPIVAMQSGRYVAPPSFLMKAAKRRFVATYYRTGEKYRLLSGGSYVGSATIKKTDPCDETTANVDMQTSLNLGSGVNAFATNSDSLAGKSPKRRELTEREQTEIMKLVQPVFKHHGLDEPSLTGVSSGAEAVDLDGDGKDELIGFFAVGAKSEHSLFIIAEPQGNGFRAALSLFHQSRDEFHDDRIYYRFLDGLDLDGDRVAEVVVSVNDWRSTNAWDYIIYKKQRGQWRRIYRGGGYRECESEQD